MSSPTRSMDTDQAATNGPGGPAAQVTSGSDGGASPVKALPALPAPPPRTTNGPTSTLVGLPLPQGILAPRMVAAPMIPGMSLAAAAAAAAVNGVLPGTSRSGAAPARPAPAAQLPPTSDGDIVLDVECGPNKAKIYLSKLCQGSKGPCVLYNQAWLTPNEFQYVSGRETAKDWKRSIRHHGKSMKLLMAKGVMALNPPSCRCEACTGVDPFANVSTTPIALS